MSLKLQIERIQIEFSLIVFQSQEALSHNFLYHLPQTLATFQINPKHARHDRYF